MTPLRVRRYPTLCVQQEPAAGLRGAGGRSAAAFLRENFVPPGRSLESLKGNTSITVTTQSLLYVLIWILFELLELTLA